jgi:hypothetical protein
MKHAVRTLSVGSVSGESLYITDRVISEIILSHAFGWLLMLNAAASLGLFFEQRSGTQLSFRRKRRAHL